jgi:putative redox protein
VSVEPGAGPPAAVSRPGKPPSHIVATWAGDQQFDAGRPHGPTFRVDGRAETAQSPVDALLSAFAACAAIDVVEILAKRRTPLESLEIAATGERSPGVPARFTRIMLHFRMRGAGIERQHAERAVELSITKYCSVRGTLDPAMPVEWSVEIE